MRMLMIGALTMQYIRDNWVLPLRELYDVDFVDVSLLFNCYEKEYYEIYLYSIIRSGSYDYIFFYADSIHNEFSEEFFATVHNAGIPIITFYADDEPVLWCEKNLPYDHRFDLVATHSLRGLELRKENGIGNHFMYLPWGFNHEIFDRQFNREKIYDVVYFGLCAVQKENPSVYLRDSYLRQHLLVEVYKVCQEYGLTLAIFGGGWENHPILHKCAGGVVSNDDMVSIYNQAKLVFNPGFSADNEITGYQTKLRHFEVAGCGCLQITNYNPELAELFTENESIVFFHDEIELKSKILYYLQHKVERELIAENAYVIAHKNHTMKKRITALFGRAQQLYPQKLSERRDIYRKPTIKVLRFNDAVEAYHYFESCVNRVSCDESFEFVHIIAGEMAMHTEYSILNLPLFINDAPIIGVRTYLQLATLHDEFIQRRSQNMVGRMLTEVSIKNNFHEWILEYIRSNFLVLEDENYIVPLCNYIIPAKKLSTVAKVFLNNDLAAFLNLPIYNSGLVVNDFTVAKENCPEELCSPQYITKLRQLLNNMNFLQERILLYGGRGTMADDVYAVLKNYANLNILGVVDRGLSETGILQISDYPVYRYEDIERLEPTMIIIAAENSGKQIYESIKHLIHVVKIIPLYDMMHPIWKIELPL